MAAVADAPLTGLTVVSTFSGCGGSCLGFRMAGYAPLWASEFIPAAADTYAANHSAILDRRDIRQVDPIQDVLRRLKMDVGEVDVLEGSPPCASFSVAGKREAGWGQVKKYSDSEQRVDDLFGEYVRFVRAIQPRAFVAENVPGLLIGAARMVFEHVMADLEGCGYRVAARVLNAQWYGVPQARRRLIFVGVRRDLGRAPAFPSPNPWYYSLRDVLASAGGIEIHNPASAFGPKRDGYIVDDVAPTVMAGGIGGVNRSQYQVLDSHAGFNDPGSRGFAAPKDVTDEPGRAVRTTDQGQWRVIGIQGHSNKDQLVKSPDDPVPTIRATGASTWSGHLFEMSVTDDDGVHIEALSATGVEVCAAIANGIPAIQFVFTNDFGANRAPAILLLRPFKGLSADEMREAMLVAMAADGTGIETSE